MSPVDGSMASADESIVPIYKIIVYQLSCKTSITILCLNLNDNGSFELKITQIIDRLCLSKISYY